MHYRIYNTAFVNTTKSKIWPNSSSLITPDASEASRCFCLDSQDVSITPTSSNLLSSVAWKCRTSFLWSLNELGQLVNYLEFGHLLRWYESFLDPLTCHILLLFQFLTNLTQITSSQGSLTTAGEQFDNVRTWSCVWLTAIVYIQKALAFTDITSRLLACPILIDPLHCPFQATKASKTNLPLPSK